MDQHLNYFQAQYAPSFESDQAKIDEFGIDSLNTPDINPEFFNPSNLFDKSLVKQVVDVKVDTDSDYLAIFPDLSGGNNSFDRSYSPYSKLESAAININSPEMMMPVSPNKVCPQLGYDDQVEQSTFGQTMSDYESLVNFDSYHHNNSSSPSTSSQCNSRSSSISAGSDNYLSEYILNPIESALSSTSHHHLMTGSADPTLLCRVPQSPAGSSISSSHYSSASSPQHNSKTFTQLETVQQIVIKQEPIDSLYQPTVVEEFEQYHMQPMQSQQQQVGNYSTLNTTDLSGSYYYTNALPSTVTSAIMSQQIQPVPIQPTTPTTPSHSRKRNANSAFSSSTSSSTSSSSAPAGSSSTKKPRMTKREKQKMMEGDISKYENENRDLANSIDLLERQIRFCKKFLSENVAPVIQRQQQQQMGVHFGSPSPMVITVEGM